MTGLASRARAWCLPVIGATTSLALFVAYMLRVHLTVGEAAMLGLGSIVLWGPFAIGISRLLRKEVADSAARAAIAVVASYALTPMLYFLWSMVGLPAGLYAMQAGAMVFVAMVYWQERRTIRLSLQSFPPKPNLVALGLIGLALWTTAPYTKVANVTTTGSRNLRVPTDSLYYTSQAYELARNLPPRQDPTRAGTPPRSYHLLPHVSLVLLARATGQTDLLRAQAVYHLTVLTVMTSLVLYALGKTLSGRRLGGYALVALLFPLALVGKPLLTSTTLPGTSFYLYYFTQFPQVSSMLDAVALSSWQAYSAVVVALGLLLVVATASARVHIKASAMRLLLVGALLVGSLTRFRAQVFMVALPAFLVVVAMVWWRTRQRGLIGAAVLSVAASLPLYLEATSSTYRPGSSGLGLGFNGLTVPGRLIGRVSPAFIFSGWPFSKAVYTRLGDLLSGAAFQWAWQIVCLILFVVLNVIGLLAIVALGFYLTRREAWARFRLFSVLVITMILGSLFIGVFVTSQFDSFSLSGQALMLPVWYVFPVVAVAVAAAFSLVERRLHLDSRAWVAIGVAVVLAGTWVRESSSPSQLAAFEYSQHIRLGDEITRDEWLALRHLREATAKDAVVISNGYVTYDLMFSGVAGRAGYAEAVGDINDTEALRIYGDDRVGVINELWSTTDSKRFCDLLKSTPSTHLVEFGAQPLVVRRLPCLGLDWSSPEDEVRIWTIRPGG